MLSRDVGEADGSGARVVKPKSADPTDPELHPERVFDTLVDPADGAPRGTLMEAAEDPLLGSRVGNRYLVESVIADGGMGRVYLATDPERGRVALKTLIPQYSVDRELVRRFRREVTTLQEAQCPHVVAMYEWGELPDGRAFFVMEYVDGVSLSDELETLDGPMDPGRALRITLQLCAALVPAHALGIVHRDLKPDNLMLCRIDGEEDVVKVLDFGLAKPMGEALGITQPGRLLGTPVYMSPEQCRGKPLDERSDIYSLGVLLYELLCGEPPFIHDQPYAIIKMHVGEAPVAPSRREPRILIPKPLEWMLLCCLHKDPARRFQTMREVHEEMGHIASALSVELPVSAR